MSKSDLNHQPDLFVVHWGVPTSKLDFETFLGELVSSPLFLCIGSQQLSQVVADNSNRPADHLEMLCAHLSSPVFYQGKTLDHILSPGFPLFLKPWSQNNRGQEVGRGRSWVIEWEGVCKSGGDMTEFGGGRFSGKASCKAYYTVLSYRMTVGPEDVARTPNWHHTFPILSYFFWSTCFST